MPPFEAGLQIKVKNYRYEACVCRPTLQAMNRTQKILKLACSATPSALIVLGLGCCATLAMTEAQATDTVAPASVTQRDGQHDFEFIFGRWKIHLKRRVHSSTGSDTWTEFDGYGRYQKIWDGRANLNDFEADSPTGHVEGLTLRTYNPQTHQWSLYWANSQDGILGVPQVGQFRDGQGEFYAQDTIDGKAVFIRYVWSKITPKSVHFEQAFSSDGGRSWDVNWISDMVRTSDESDGGTRPVEARPTSATTAGMAGGGQHDFDPLLGSWKYRLKRRTNPLTGSANWVDLTGTGVCYPLWNRTAQLDTFLVDGPKGRIEGLTLRLYNPKSRQWRLYWANSKDGIVSVPQIGEFNKGRGEFYAQDTLDDKSILIRYDWTALPSPSPHFEQSFSEDGGKTWEVNWITDQTRQ
jgi:hypothetical protein